MSGWKDNKQLRNLVFYPSGSFRKSSVVEENQKKEDSWDVPAGMSKNTIEGLMENPPTPTELLLPEVARKLNLLATGLGTENSLRKWNSELEEEEETPTADVPVESAEKLLSEPEETQFPSFRISPNKGIISVHGLREDFVAEISLNGNIRLLLRGNIAVAVTSNSSAVGIMHHQARIIQENQKLLAQFGREKLVFAFEDSLLFTSKRIRECFLLSHSVSPEPKVVPTSMVQFPSIGRDFTLDILHDNQGGGGTSKENFYKSKDIVRAAHWEEKEGSLIIHINDIIIRQNKEGRVDICSGSRNISLHPRGNVFVKTDKILTGIENGEDKSSIKWRELKIHSNKKGMYVTDGHHTLTMDAFGKLVV